MKRILVVSPTPTHPAIAGNRACILSYVELLKSLGNDVYFFWVVNPVYSDEDFKETQKYWGQHFFYYKKNIAHRILEFLFKRLRFGLTGYYKVDDMFPFGIERKARWLQRQFCFDVVIVNYVYLSKVFKFFRNSKKVLFTHDVFTNKYQRTNLDWFSLKPNEEAKALNRADLILAIQKHEELFYSYLTTKPVFTSYNSFPVNRTPLAKNKNILFLSSANKYNIEGIDWFITNVMATLKGVLPSVKLIMGGSVCNVLKNRYSDCENIRFVGQVDDLFEFYSMGDIAVNPVFNGTGLKIKTFEAMSFGKVLIANPHSVEGVFNLNSCPVKIATSSNDYVEIITELINNPSEIKNLSDLSVKYISELNNEVKRVFLQTIEC